MHDPQLTCAAPVEALTVTAVLAEHQGEQVLELDRAQANRQNGWPAGSNRTRTSS